MTDNNETNYDADITKEDGEAKITAEISWETLQDYREEALAGLRENVDIDGFRQENIPEDVLEDHIGEMGVISEMAQLAISDIYPKIVADNKLQTIGRPDVKITKISKDNPLEFEATATLMPTVKLADNYLEIAAEAYEDAEEEAESEGGNEEIDDDEVEEAIQAIRQQWAQAQKQQEAQQEADGDDFDPSELEVTEEDLPEVDDEFVKQVSNAETVDEFKETIRENIGKQNNRKQEEAKRGQMIQAVVDAATADLPDLVVEGELDKMMAQFESDVARSGMEMDDYFEQADTSKEEMRDKWRPDAERRAKTQLVLNKIAAEEDIQADDEAVDEEVKQIMAQYDDEVPEARARTFVRSRMINENTIEFLESQAK